jgi:hypothetical protein
MPALNLKIPPVNRKQGPAVLNNKKQDNFNQIHTKNPDKGTGDSQEIEKYFVLAFEKFKKPAATHT